MFHCSWCKNYDVLNFPNNKQCKKCDNGSMLKIKISGIEVIYYGKNRIVSIPYEHDNVEEAIFESFERFNLYNENVRIDIGLEYIKGKFKKIVYIR